MDTLHKPTERVLLILETLANEEGMTLSALAAKTGISKGTIFPILKSLLSRKYINHNEKTGLYTLGISCAVLASATVEKEYWLRMVNAEMRNVVTECNEVCQMGVLDGAHVLYIDKIQGEQTVQLVSKIGTRLPAIFSALGKAMLSQCTDEEIMALYPNGFTPVTSRSVRSPQKLREQLNEIVAKGYAMDDREINEDTVCFAVPLWQKGRILAAISVSLPYFRATQEKNEQVLASLILARKKIENTLDKLPEISHF
jgi:IclR family KDG regulon transcriptional repressor